MVPAVRPNTACGGLNRAPGVVGGMNFFGLMLCPQKKPLGLLAARSQSLTNKGVPTATGDVRQSAGLPRVRTLMERGELMK